MQDGCEPVRQGKRKHDEIGDCGDGEAGPDKRSYTDIEDQKVVKALLLEYLGLCIKHIERMEVQGGALELLQNIVRLNGDVCEPEFNALILKVSKLL